MKISRRWVIVCIVLLTLLFLLVAQFSVRPEGSLVTAAAALTVVTVAAIGIERALELIWTMVGMTKGTWWPFKLMNERVTEIEGSLNEVLTPIQKQAELLAQGAVQNTKFSAEDVAVVEKALDEVRQKMAQLQTLAPSAQRANLIAATALQGVSYIEQRYPDLQAATAPSTRRPSAWRTSWRPSRTTRRGGFSASTPACCWGWWSQAPWGSTSLLRPACR